MSRWNFLELLLWVFFHDPSVALSQSVGAYGKHHTRGRERPLPTDWRPNLRTQGANKGIA